MLLADALGLFLALLLFGLALLLLFFLLPRLLLLALLPDRLRLFLALLLFGLALLLLTVLLPLLEYLVLISLPLAAFAPFLRSFLILWPGVGLLRPAICLPTLLLRFLGFVVGLRIWRRLLCKLQRAGGPLCRISRGQCEHRRYGEKKRRDVTRSWQHDLSYQRGTRRLGFRVPIAAR